MQISIDLPVLFKAKALRGDDMKTMLHFVPTVMDIAEAADEEAPLAVSVCKPLERTLSSFRLYDGALYGSLKTIEGKPIDEGAVIARRIHEKIARRLVDILSSSRIDDLYPKDARDLVGMVNVAEGYEEYLRRIQDRLAAKNMAAATADNDDFVRGYAASLDLAREEAAAHLFVDGVRYRRTMGLLVKVETHYNNTVRVSTEEAWHPGLWKQDVGEVSTNSTHSHWSYFSLADEDKAREFAERISRELGQPIVEWSHQRDRTIQFHVPKETLPQFDWDYAEVVRSAKMVCHLVGSELARRIRNQESSIFSDDPSLRYAFDSLREVLRDADPFGEPDDRIETEATRMLTILDKDRDRINARYRSLATNHAPFFDHLKASLERFENRDIEVEVALGSTLGMYRAL